MSIEFNIKIIVKTVERVIPFSINNSKNVFILISIPMIKMNTYLLKICR